MAWYLNHYVCYQCDESWTDEWSCMCDDDCPHCGARHSSPDESDDLTTLVEAEAGEFIIYYSPETAEDKPDYRELGVNRTESGR